MSEIIPPGRELMAEQSNLPMVARKQRLGKQEDIDRARQSH